MYTVTQNIPGYLPEIEPVSFDTIAEAWSYVIEEINGDIEATLEYENFEDAALPDFKQGIEDAKRARDNSLLGHIIVDGLAYSVEPTQN